jgi:predicted HNH restriction endonuclease
VGEGFIEIHHLEKISTGGRRRINPQTDLLPVCSNCHSMLHREDPPISPDYLLTLISKADE